MSIRAPEKKASAPAEDPAPAADIALQPEAASAEAPCEPHTSAFDEEKLEENEPYLGPAWAAAMLVLYVLKELFPAPAYSALWWFQMYIIGLVVSITLFTLLKRHQFYKAERKRLENTKPRGQATTP